MADNHDEEAARSPSSTPVNEEPYSIYTTKEKWLIVAFVALAGFYRSVISSLFNILD
jgi:hypothetical protein